MNDTKSSPLKTVLLTGASSGIGLALAQALIRSEYRCILTARKESLDKFAAAGIQESELVHIRPLDVTVSAESAAVVEEFAERGCGVDILINNAGICYRSVVEHIDETDILEQLRVNYIGAAMLMKLVLPAMRAKRWGRIINISSVGGMMAMPTMGLYSASKFALEGLTEALWYEAKPWNIAVTLVQPGFIRSESFKRVVLTKGAEQETQHPGGPYEAYYKHMSCFIEKYMHRSLVTPEDVAAKVLKLLRTAHPPLRVPLSYDARFFGCIRRLLPRRLYHALLYRALPGIAEWGS